jgi:hypothetical protein
MCLLFTLWFASGVVLHFVPYPALSETERVARSAPIRLSEVAVPPGAAFAVEPEADGVRLVEISGRPVYILHVPARSLVAVSAVTGERLRLLSAQDAARIASGFQRAKVGGIVELLDYDQWTVAQEFDSFRPLYRVHTDDAAGTVLYVSARSGEVIQRTTRSERLWNWFGANIHWIYFSALRVHWSAWDRIVWGLSLVGLIVTAAGLLLGWVRFAAIRRFRRRGLTPFRGWLAWHHRIGLFAGIFVLTWILSGWLSMDHGRIFSTGIPTATQISAVQGVSLKKTVTEISAAALQAVGSASEIRITAVAGHACWIAHGGAKVNRVFCRDSSRAWPDASIPDAWLVAGVQALRPAQRVIDLGSARADDLYALAEGVPAAGRRMRIAGPRPLDIYIDTESGQLVSVLDPGRRAYAWLYYALHTFKFPGLVNFPVLRHIAVLGPLIVGFVFSLTGVIVAIGRLRASRGQSRPQASVAR